MSDLASKTEATGYRRMLGVTERKKFKTFKTRPGRLSDYPSWTQGTQRLPHPGPGPHTTFDRRRLHYTHDYARDTAHRGRIDQRRYRALTQKAKSDSFLTARCALAAGRLHQGRMDGADAEVVQLSDPLRAAEHLGGYLAEAELIAVES